MNYTDYHTYKEDYLQNGYATIPSVYTAEEVRLLRTIIETKYNNNAGKGKAVFAIRQCLKEIPELTTVLLNRNFRQLVDQLCGKDYFIVKSIYFDKPEEANWYVAYHQDLMITVAEKRDTPGFGPWTAKAGQYTVQPPVSILEHIYTIRIHLDDTDAENGALKVIPGSHLKGITRPELIDHAHSNELQCTVPEGGVMLMRPLLLHSSARSLGYKRRRVIHIEVSNSSLPLSLQWSEKLEIHK